MLYSEFVNKTNLEVSTEYFEEIHDLYLESDMDKDDFCEHFLKERNNPLFIFLVKERREFKKESVAAYVERARMQKKDLAIFLIEKSISECSNELYEKAIEFIGHKECIKYKLEQELPLKESDRKELAKIIG